MKMAPIFTANQSATPNQFPAAAAIVPGQASTVAAEPSFAQPPPLSQSNDFFILQLIVMVKVDQPCIAGHMKCSNPDIFMLFTMSACNTSPMMEYII